MQMNNLLVLKMCIRTIWRTTSTTTNSFHGLRSQTNRVSRQQKRSQ